MNLKQIALTILTLGVGASVYSAERLVSIELINPQIACYQLDTNNDFKADVKYCGLFIINGDKMYFAPPQVKYTDRDKNGYFDEHEGERLIVPKKPEKRKRI